MFWVESEARVISLDSRQLAAVGGVWGRKLERLLLRRGFQLSMIDELRFDAGFGRGLEIVVRVGQLELGGGLAQKRVASEFWADEKALHVKLQEFWAQS